MPVSVAPVFFSYLLLFIIIVECLFLIALSHTCGLREFFSFCYFQWRMGSGWSSYTPHALFTPGISWSPWWHCFTLTAQILLYSPLSARPACRCCISRLVIFNKWLSLFASVSCGLIRLWTSGGKRSLSCTNAYSYQYYHQGTMALLSLEKQNKNMPSTWPQSSVFL